VLAVRSTHTPAPPVAAAACRLFSRAAPLSSSPTPAWSRRLPARESPQMAATTPAEGPRGIPLPRHAAHHRRQGRPQPRAPPVPHPPPPTMLRRAAGPASPTSRAAPTSSSSQGGRPLPERRRSTAGEAVPAVARASPASAITDRRVPQVDFELIHPLLSHICYFCREFDIAPKFVKQILLGPS
jgi:hypothetical protein